MKSGVHKSSLRRRRPTQARAQATVEAMLDAAVVLLKRYGASSITTNRIAETAGVSIGSVYQYFPNKQAIFVALHERHIRDVDTAIRRKIAECTHAPLEKLILSLLDGMVEIHARDSRLAALLQSEVPHRAGGAAEFSSRLSYPLLSALAPHAKSLSRRSDLRTCVFVMAEILDALGHSIVLRRPPMLSLEAARHEASKAMLAYLTL